MCQYAFAQKSVYFYSLFHWVPAVWTLSTFAQGIAILHPPRPGITLFGEENHMWMAPYLSIWAVPASRPSSFSANVLACLMAISTVGMGTPGSRCGSISELIHTETRGWSEITLPSALPCLSYTILIYRPVMSWLRNHLWSVIEAQ